MPKTFPIRLDVEEIALGTVLRKLNEMAGIVKLHLDLGHGGQGPGRKQLEHHAAVARVQNGSREPLVLKLLMQGPKHIREISELLGGAMTRAYGLMNSLQKKGLTKSIGKGMHELSKKAKAQIGGAMAAVPALPAPSPVQLKHGPGGRASPGSGNTVLRAILADGPLTPAEVRAKATAQGMSAKSVSGVIDRAKRGGFIKKNGTGYELTAKGHKIEMGASANG